MEPLSGSARPPLLRRLAASCYDRRRAVVGLWVLLFASVIGLSAAAGGEFDNAFDLPGSESQDAFDLLEDGGFTGLAGSTVQAVIETDQGVDNRSVQAGVERFLGAVEAEVPDVEVVSPYEQGG